MINALQEIKAIREERLRKTASLTLGFALLLSIVFLVRAIEWGLYGRVVSLSLCFGLLVCSLTVIRTGGTRSLAAILGILGCCIAAGYATYSSGGLNSTATGWLIILPLIGANVGGKTGGICAFVFSLATGLGLFASETLYGTPENITPEAFRLSQDRLSQLGQLLIVSFSIIGLFRQITFSEHQLSDSVLRLVNEVEARTTAEQNAERANNIKSEFLANMSHEIRTPMNGIKGILDALEQEELNEKQQDYVKLASFSCESLMVLINDILDLAKIESGKLYIEHTDFDLEDLINNITRLHAATAQNKSLSLTCNASLGQTMVNGDPTRIRQVIDNLINNAIKFTETGGIILSIELSETEADKFQFSFTVEDTGIGIPKDKLAILFTPFHQVETSTTRRFGGSGLGLAISKQLVTKMGGSIQVDSEVGKGSRFSFNITLDRPSTAEEKAPADNDLKPQQQSPQKDHEPNKVKVLLVEDNDINIIVATAILEAFPLTIEVAKNGVQALQMIEKNRLSEHEPYQAVLMDCQMPEMDGFETSRRLREDPNFQELPIIAMTANAMKGDKEKCLAAGMSDYISKPIDTNVIEEKLFKWLKVRRAK